MIKHPTNKPIAFTGNITTKESLPYPIVLYPGFYGGFFGFKVDTHSEILFCSCAKEAIENYITFRLLGKHGSNIEQKRNFILDAMYFPLSVVEELISLQLPQDKSIINYLHFENKICHECNRVLPTYRYCHEMYGSKFKQNYGWYINKQAFEWGIEPISNRVLDECCPIDILEEFKRTPQVESKPPNKRDKFYTKQRYQLFLQDQKHKYRDKQWRHIWRIIENEVRDKFGHKRVGEAWTSETILYYLVRSLFPTKEILRHYRPRFLCNLELDIYIPDLRIGIEYQGYQHYYPVKHWGGEARLKELQARDRRKCILCEKEGVRLIHFRYDEELSETMVKEKLKEVI